MASIESRFRRAQQKSLDSRNSLLQFRIRAAISYLLRDARFIISLKPHSIAH